MEVYDLWELAVAFKLTPKLCYFLKLLLTLPVVRRDQVDQCIVHRLRIVLKKHGIKIESKRNLGYYLSNQEVLHIQAALTKLPHTYREPPNGPDIHA